MNSEGRYVGEQFDVAIIGGGIAGLVASIELAQTRSCLCRLVMLRPRATRCISWCVVRETPSRVCKKSAY
ncbi:FAD-binding protein [Paenibacillus sp. LMG 31456]|uniref:FAD-binding protein n=1 Tax=Paenibacillus foliorum TaxID=2654974 RepID=A0A972H3Q4_9BACL|nr:FAD-binding protein [Paenibacillus foliorum]